MDFFKNDNTVLAGLLQCLLVFGLLGTMGKKLAGELAAALCMAA